MPLSVSLISPLPSMSVDRLPVAVLQWVMSTFTISWKVQLGVLAFIVKSNFHASWMNDLCVCVTYRQKEPLGVHPGVWKHKNNAWIIKWDYKQLVTGPQTKVIIQKPTLKPNSINTSFPNTAPLLNFLTCNLWWFRCDLPSWPRSQV